MSRCLKFDLRSKRDQAPTQLYRASAPLRPSGPGRDSPVLPLSEFERLDPPHRPDCFVDEEGRTLMLGPMFGLTLARVTVFRYVRENVNPTSLTLPGKSMKEAVSALKGNGIPRLKASALVLTALAGDFDEYVRVSYYDATEVDHWWRETVLTPQGAAVSEDFNKRWN
jgi:hypothetical protein